MIISFNDESLKRHKITHEECHEVLADPTKIECDPAK